jgi:diguanylate cyclase (GGDEF)-like protein/PAS domain S-box-containing protein
MRGQPLERDPEGKPSRRVARPLHDRYRALFEQMPAAIAVFDTDCVVREVNQACCLLMGATAEEIVGSDLRGHLSPDLLDVADRALAGETVTYEGEHHFAQFPGQFWLQSRWAPLVDERGEVTGGIVGAIEVSRVRQAENLVERLAFTDPVTMMPNRTMLSATLERALGSVRAQREHIALVWLNLDRFKDINHAFGQPSGDQLLRAVGARLTRLVRRGDLVARTGGDDFLVLLRWASSRDHVHALTQRIANVFSEPFLLDKLPVYLTASCGAAMHPDDGGDAHSLLENAHSAMQSVKREGGGAYRLYEHRHRAASTAKVRLAAELRRAIAEEEFVIYYQPQLTAAGQVVALEALVRWQNPSRGLLAPAEFIVFAEQTGLIENIGSLVLRAACAQVHDWQVRLGSVPRLAVNVSAREFQRTSLLESLRAAVGANDLSPERLEVEITETAILADPSRAARLVADLRAAGFSVALDDFGTGYSSLSHLRELAIDRVKIDRSFVSNCLTDASAGAIVSAVTRLSHSLGLEVVAEGVETKAQLAFLRKVGCDLLQGYLFAEALSPPECEAFMLRHGAGSAAGGA